MSKEKRFLITTALEQTWVEDQPVLFLGEWCRLHSRKSRWSNMNADVQSYHWDDRERFYADYVYLNNLYERVLEELAVKLNQIHGVDCGLRYWRILVGPWLAYFIHILFDRWINIENALNSYEITGTIAVKRIKPLVANDMTEFLDLFLGDEWNHQIYLEIISKISKISVSLIKVNNQNLAKKPTKKKLTIKNCALNIYSRFAKRFIRDDDLFINRSYLTLYNEALLQCRFGQIPQFWIDQKPEQANFECKMREWKFSIKTQNNFEDFLLSQIPGQIPRTYIEGYKSLIVKVKALPWPKSPKLLFSSSILWHNDVSKAYFAEKTQRGVPLVYGQHGGGYGTAKFHFAEEHEIAIADKYLTWGWKNSIDKKVIPIGIFKVPKKIRRKFNERKKLLCLTLGISRYSYRLCAESAINYQNYINRNFAFVSHLKGEVLEDFLLRLPPSDDGQDAFLRWRERFPSLEIDHGFRKINSLMRDARLVVQTYNQTGLLESLALGIPSILFSELNVTPIRETAVPYYAELKHAGIFHESPESAALHINNVWDDVDAWWGSDQVQTVIESFKKQYCYQPENLLDEIEIVLCDMISESSNKAVKVKKL